MLQIVFNEISAAEMAALPKEMQLDLLTEFQFLPEDLDQLDMEKFGAVVVAAIRFSYLEIVDEDSVE